MLIDAGWVGKLDRFKKCLDTLNIRLDEIKYIFLTHHHHDHVALVQDLRELTHAKLIIHRLQIPFITEGITDHSKVRQYNWILLIIDRILRPFISFDYKPIRIDDTDFVIDNDIDENTLRHIDVEGRVVSTPGHSGDSMSILLDNGDAYVGDLAMDLMGLICKPPLPVEAENYEQVNDSLKKLINLGARNFYPSHGKKIDCKQIEMIIK